MVEITACGSGVPVTVAVRVERSTVTEVTPGSVARFFSTLFLQWTHAMPLILYSLVISSVVMWLCE